MRVAQRHTLVNVHETERDLHTMHTIQHRLIWLYTWLQQAKKGKNQKKYGANAPQLHHIWPQAAPGAIRQHLFPLSITDGEGARG